MTSIEGRVAVEFFSESKQSKKYAFKCHRQVIDGTDTVYPVQGLIFNPVSVLLPPPFSPSNSRANSLVYVIRHGTFSTGGGDATVSLWDPFAKKRLRQFSKYPNPISALAFSCDGKRLAVAYSQDDEGGKGEGGNGVWIRECGDEVKPKGK